MKKALLIAILGLSSVAFGQKTYQLKVDAPIGTKHNLKIVTRMIGQTAKGEMGFEGTMNQVLKRKSASELEWNVKFKITSKYGRGAFKGGEEAFADLDGMVMDMTMEPTGKMKKVRMGEIEVPSSGTPSVIFPAKPVKIGSTWPGYADMSGQKVKITYTLASVTTSKGKNIALIKGIADKGQMVKNVTPIQFWVDMKTGLMERAEAKLLISTQGQTVRLEYLINRQN